MDPATARYFADMEAKLLMAPLIREILLQLAPTLLDTKQHKVHVYNINNYEVEAWSKGLLSMQKMKRGR